MILGIILIGATVGLAIEDNEPRLLLFSLFGVPLILISSIGFDSLSNKQIRDIQEKHKTNVEFCESNFANVEQYQECLDRIK
jgi:AAA15 family ATPase/GTPase